jgi:hypothetical protein
MKDQLVTAHRLSVLSGVSRYNVLKFVAAGVLPAPIIRGKYFPS